MRYCSQADRDRLPVIVTSVTLVHEFLRLRHLLYRQEPDKPLYPHAATRTGHTSFVRSVPRIPRSIVDVPSRLGPIYVIVLQGKDSPLGSG